MNTATYNTMLRDFAQATNVMNKIFARELNGYDYARNGGHNSPVANNATNANGATETAVSPTVAKARLPLDVRGSDDAFVFTAYLPGVKPEEVEITFAKDELTIRGQFPVIEGESEWIKRELFHGPFERTLNFNTPVNSEAIEAHFENGVLTLRVPKAEVAKPKKIAVVTR